MADQITTIATEQGPSLAAVNTPVPESENLAPMAAPMVLASVDVAVKSEPLAAVGSKPASTNGEPYTVTVKAPPAGGMLAYLVGPGAQIELQGIDLNKATMAEEGGNLRITLPNGAEILLLDYVNAAHDSHTTVITEDGKLPAQQLLAALDNAEIAQKVADVEPAAGPAAGGEGGGLLPPTILGLGVGEGEGIFSSVIGPYAIPRPTDAIFTNEYPFEPGVAPANPVVPPVTPPVNQPPLARNDSFSTAVDKPITVQPGQLLVNDSDPEGDPLKIVSVQGATHGTVALNPDGTVTFTPEAGFHGTGSYSYTITDGKGGTSTADVIIQIDPNPVTQNNVIAADDAGTVVEGKSITINVLANDSDPEGDALVPGSVRIIAGPNGQQPDVTAHTNPDGTITFTTVDHHSTAPYFVTLQYEVSDARGARDTATVTVEVIPSANNVIAVDDTGEIFPAGQTRTFNVVGNDYDPQGDSFQITRIVTGPSQGRAIIDPAHGTITYESVASNTGYTETITYEITDARGATDTATLTIRVEPTNSVNAVDDTADLKAGQDVRIDVLRNDSDPQGDAFHITRIVGQPTVRDGSGFGDPRGSVTINSDGTITYTDTPGARNAGVVEFSYEIVDSKGATDIAVVRVTIGTAPNGVDANNDTLTITQDAPRANVTNTLLANDFDPQGDKFHITAITQPTTGHGTVELVGDQVFFTPANGYHGPVVFTYTITDALGATDTAQVYINVQAPLSTGLNAGDDAFSTPFNTNLTITPTQLLANDNDPDGTVLNAANIISHTNPLNGTLTVDANGNFIYNPNDTFRGTDSFTYTIKDAQGDIATATVTIRVADPLPQDNPVDAVNDNYTVRPAETVNFNVLTNDSAPDGGLAFVRVVGNLPAGVTDLGNGHFSYTAPAGSGSNSVTFQYEARDVDGDTDIATVTINVSGNNVVAVDDTATMAKDVNSILINAKANDFDPQGDAFSITRIISVDSGTATIENGQIRYTNGTRDAGVAHIVYEITDAKGAKDTATITVNIAADSNNVVAVDDTATMAKDVNSILINAKANDFDPQGDAFSITRIISVDSGTATIENGQIRYTNGTRDAGVAHIVYEITDAKGAKDTATITVNIAADSNNVVAVDDTATMAKDVNSILINAKANDFDPQGDAFSITRIISVDSGTATIENGQIRYTNGTRDAGVAHIVYEITDAKGAKDTATITVNIAADSNNVVAVDDTATMAKDVNSILINAKANDFDPQGDAFSITRIISVDSGTATIENGQIRYTNGTRDAGVAHIVYEITDAKGAKDTATITVNIAADSNNVVAVDDTATMAKDVNSILINAKANDFDPQGDAFSITRIISVDSGTATIENGQIRYTNGTRDAGVAHIVYEITDAKGAKDTATITVNIAADSNNVVAVDDTATMAKDVNSILINAKANDFDPQGDAFSITRIISVDSGTATIENGQIRYTNGTRDAGVAHIVYEITDAKGAKDTATITVNIAADSNNVVAVDDTAIVNSRRDSVAISVLANDYDPQGDSFHISRIVSGPAIGSAYVNSNGTITYNPGNGRSGYTTTFVYEIVDSHGATSQATVTVNVSSAPNPGDGGHGGDHGGGDCPLTIDLLGNGISIGMKSGSVAHFDLNGDGHAEWTSWVNGADDAILSIDRNGNGIIDNINEVFGGKDIDGFSELARLEDTNGDGVVDHNDANWSSLKLWLDANHDGITDAGELHGLEEFGIVSINTHSTGTSIQYGDAYIDKVGTVTLNDGSHLSAGSVFYTNASNGHLVGTSHNDVLIYSAAADTIDGGQGMDTLKVLTAADIVINHDTMHSVESIDMANNGADHLTLNVNDVLNLSDNGILTITGDAVDQVTLNGAVTHNADVTQNGHTYASYTAGNGGTVLVELGLTVHTQEQQH